MPEISRFYGICVLIYFRDHNPPYVHVSYNEFEAVYDIDSLSLLEGALPKRAEKMFMEWAIYNREELQEIWETQRFRKLPPLM